jgi:hypothetical protein
MTIFLLEPNLSTYLSLADTVGPRRAIEVFFHVQNVDLAKFRQSMFRRMRLRWNSPAATLELLQKDFDVDFLQWGGAMLVSERMRDAMALDPSEVRFLEIDDSRSAPLPRSKKYQIMEPEVAENVSDREATPYKMEQFEPDMPDVPCMSGHLVLRADAAPVHDLFYDAFFTKQVLCTDAFAVRVLEAGCTGMRFRRPSTKEDHRLYLRTLRGIERIGVAEVDGEFIEVVEDIIDLDETAS